MVTSLSWRTTRPTSKSVLRETEGHGPGPLRSRVLYCNEARPGFGFSTASGFLGRAGAAPRDEVVVDARRVAARATQGVALQVQRLRAVGFGDPSVTDHHVSQTRVWDMGGSMTSAACQCAPYSVSYPTFSKRQPEGRKDGTQDGSYQPAETGLLLRARARSGPAAPLHTERRGSGEHQRQAPALDVSATIALEGIGWGTADHWMRMQASYELAQAHQDRAAAEQRAAGWSYPHARCLSVYCGHLSPSAFTISCGCFGNATFHFPMGNGRRGGSVIALVGAGLHG